MSELNIVLVEPEIPQNTGNIARTCAATGARLHLVKPLGFEIDDRRLKRAGLDYWWLLDVTVYEGLDDFFSRNRGPFYYFSTKARNVYSDIAYPDGCYIVFGKETAGLAAGGTAKGESGYLRASADEGGGAKPQPVEHRRRGRV